MLESIINHDTELFLALNNLGTPSWDAFWLIITNKYSHIPLYLLLIFLAYKTFGVKKTIISAIALILLVTISDQTSNWFKYGFERLRPCYQPELEDLFRLVKDSCGGRFSFFSAHASNSMAIGVFFGLLFRNRYKYSQALLIAWSLLLGYSRIYIGVHYPIDIIIGFLAGAIYATLIYFLMSWMTQKMNI